MSLSSAILWSIAGWRFVIWGRTDWLSLTIQTFCSDSSVWIICNACNRVVLDMFSTEA